ADGEPAFDRYRDDLAAGLRHLADVAIARGSLSDAESHLLESLTIRRQLFDAAANKRAHSLELAALVKRAERLHKAYVANGQNTAKMLQRVAELIPPDDTKSQARIKALLAQSTSSDQ